MIHGWVGGRLYVAYTSCTSFACSFLIVPADSYSVMLSTEMSRAI